MSFAPIDTPAAGAAPRMDAEWLDAHWMPYTANRQFKQNPRMIVEASGAYFTDSEGRKIFDGLSGCLLYTSPSPRDKRQSRMPSSA